MSRETIVSNRYQGEAGSHYVAHYQADPEEIGYELNFAYFKPLLRPTDAVLDFGCGNGGMLRLIDGYVDRAEGLEVNPHAAATARALGLTVHADLAGLSAVSAYDVVVSNHVLEHIRDVPGTLEALRACLKPGGRLVLKLPIDDWRAPKQQRWSKDDIDHHLQTWTPRLIANVLYESGFEVDDIRIITSAWHPKLFPLRKLRLDKLAYWAFAMLKRRRQLFVVGHAPG